MAKKKTKRQKARKAGFDSGLEQELAEGPLKEWDYHPPTLKYTVPAREARYTPDFKKGKYLIESKGFLRAGDPSRYVIIHQQLKEQGYELVFVFQNENLKMPNARKRKDGTFYTLKEWAVNNSILWYNTETVNQLGDTTC